METIKQRTIIAVKSGMGIKVTSPPTSKFDKPVWNVCLTSIAKAGDT